MLAWPEEQRFPAIDVSRLIALHPQASKMIHTEYTEGAEALYEEDIFSVVLNAGLESSSVPCQMLAVRFLVNLFKWEYFGVCLSDHQEDILDKAADLATSTNKGAKLAVVILVLNYAVYYLKAPSLDGKTQCLSILSEVLSSDETESEIVFTSLVAVGTLIYKDEESSQLVADLGIKEHIKKCCASSIAKIKQCATEVLKTLQ